jgi:hypothetical protein
MDEATTKLSLVRKLVKIMAAVNHVDKLGRNEKHGYDYMKATDLMRAVRGKLADLGVLMITDIIDEVRWEKPTAAGGVMNYVSITAEFRFLDADSDATITFRGRGWGLRHHRQGGFQGHHGRIEGRPSHRSVNARCIHPEHESVDKLPAATCYDCGAAVNDFQDPKSGKLIPAPKLLAKSRKLWRVSLCAPAAPSREPSARPLKQLRNRTRVTTSCAAGLLRWSALPMERG